MPYRRVPLATTEIYHVFTKSIAGFKIFNSDKAFQRMKEAMVFYSAEDTPCKLSLFLERDRTHSNAGLELGTKRIVRIIAYCFMPTHIHLLLQQLEDNGISRYINLILKSYAKYFNITHNRKGPLWEGRFKNVLVDTDEQLLHLTRYIHLNPVTAGIVDKPEEWLYSSYREYIDMVDKKKCICKYKDIVDITPGSYKKFAEDRISYQRELERIKHLVLE